MKDLLLVVDMQNGFVNEKVRPIIPNIIKLIEYFIELDKPIAFSRFVNAPNSNYRKLIGWNKVQTEPEISIISELQVFTKGAFVFDKHYYTPYTSNFRSFLEKQNIQRIFICGVATDSCILKAAMDIFEDDKEPIVISDACYSHAGEEAHQAGLLLIGRNIGRGQCYSTMNVAE